MALEARKVLIGLAVAVFVVWSLEWMMNGTRFAAEGWGSAAYVLLPISLAPLAVLAYATRPWNDWRRLLSARRIVYAVLIADISLMVAIFATAGIVAVLN